MNFILNCQRAKELKGNTIATIASDQIRILKRRSGLMIKFNARAA